MAALDQAGRLQRLKLIIADLDLLLHLTAWLNRLLPSGKAMRRGGDVWISTRFTQLTPKCET